MLHDAAKPTLKEALSLYDQGLFPEAREVFIPLLSFGLDPDDSIIYYTHFGIARCMYKCGEYKEAGEYFISIRELYPESIRAILYYARCLFANGKFTEATEAIYIALSLIKGNAGYFNLAGYFCLEHKQYELANHCFKKAIEADTEIKSNILFIYLSLAREAVRAKDYEQAVVLYNEASKIDENEIGFYLEKSFYLFLTGKVEEYINCCKMVVKCYKEQHIIESDNYYFHLAVGYIYYGIKGEIDKAEKSFLRGQELEPKSIGILSMLALLNWERMNLSTSKKEEGNFRRTAEKFFNDAKSIYKSYPKDTLTMETILFQCSWTILSKGLKKKDQKSIEKTIKDLQKKDPKLACLLAMAYRVDYTLDKKTESKLSELYETDPQWAKIEGTEMEPFYMKLFMKRVKKIMENRQIASMTNFQKPVPFLNADTVASTLLGAGFLFLTKVFIICKDSLHLLSCGLALIGIAVFRIFHLKSVQTALIKAIAGSPKIYDGQSEGPQSGTHGHLPVTKKDYIKIYETFKGLDV